MMALVIACGGGGSDKSPVTAADICAATADAPGIVSSGDLIETSGIASSGLNDDFFWAHNDSGDSARVFALGREEQDGRHHARQHATYTLPDVQAIDWEDMAIGPGPEEDVSYLYLADIGDNAAQRPEVYVYRVREPEVVEQPDTPTAHDVAAVEKLTLVYPDHPHDAEVFLVDPVDGTMVIITKELQSPASLIFTAPANLEDGSTTTLEQVAEVDFQALRSSVLVPPDGPALPRAVPHLPTAGDVSPDGSLIAIRTYASVWVWARPEGEPLWTAFDSQPCEAPSVIEPQGEGIAFDADGRGYFTISEGSFPPFHHFVASR